MTQITRKEGKIETRMSRLNINIVYLLLFLTFALANLFYVRSEMSLIGYLIASYGLSFNIPSNVLTYIIFSIVNALISILLLEAVMTIYYFFSFQYMKGLTPFSLNEFKTNARPYLILRNVIWAVLASTMFLQGGYTIGFGMMFFEELSTMIIFFPLFFFMKKNYIKEGYGKNVLLSFAIPFFIFNAAVLFASLVG